MRTLARPNLSRAEPSLAPFNSQRYRSHFILKAESEVHSLRDPSLSLFFFGYAARMSGTTTRPLLNDIRATSSVQQPFRLSVRFAWARTRANPGSILGAFPRPLVDRDVRRTGWIPHTALLDTEPSPVTLTRPSHFESWISTTLAATPGRLMVWDGNGMSKLRLPGYPDWHFVAIDTIVETRLVYRDEIGGYVCIDSDNGDEEEWKREMETRDTYRAWKCSRRS